MSKSNHEELTRLLKRGLNHYGLGDLDEAINCWERARDIDPDNQAVYDYLETAYEEAGMEKPEAARGAPSPVGVDDDDATPRSGPPQHAAAPVRDDDSTERSGPPAPPAVELEIDTEDCDTTIAGALSAYKGGRLDEAWVKLQKASKSYPDRLDVQGYLQLVRSEQAQRWAREIGDQGRVLTLKASTSELMNLDLHPEEGFLVSQIDSSLTIADLMSVSNCGRVRTLEIIARLLREGIVE